MAKKIALFIILVMLANMAVWADDGSDGTVIAIVALAVGIAIVVGVLCFIIQLAEAESPDDGIRLVSMQTADSESKTASGTVLNLMQHVEVGQTKDNKFYAGLRFRF
jgi:hypothetical protein